MNCEQIKDQLVLEAYGELDAEQQAVLALHLHGCLACTNEQRAFDAMTDVLDENALPELSPNLVAQSRMRLDEALDSSPRLPFADRLRNLFAGTWYSFRSAPALTALLVVTGFAGGMGFTQYQTAKASHAVSAVVTPSSADSSIGNVSNVIPTENPEVVEVRYNRMTPEVMKGSLDDPKIRQLLLSAAQHGKDNTVREESVSLLAHECRAGHQCEGGGDPVRSGQGFREALLVSLRYDKSPQVRLKALEGLQPYVGSDQRVRDVVLESLMRDPSANVRTQAISMLEPVHADSSVRQVLHTVSTQDENPYIRTASMQALEGADGIQ